MKTSESGLHSTQDGLRADVALAGMNDRARRPVIGSRTLARAETGGRNCLLAVSVLAVLASQQECNTKETVRK